MCGAHGGYLSGQRSVQRPFASTHSMQMLYTHCFITVFHRPAGRCHCAWFGDRGSICPEGFACLQDWLPQVSQNSPLSLPAPHLSGNVFPDSWITVSLPVPVLCGESSLRSLASLPSSPLVQPHFHLPHAGLAGFQRQQ